MLTPRPVGILLLLFVVAAAPRAQVPGDTALHFEVASIKPNTSGSMRTNFTNEGDRFFGSNVTLGQMLRVS